MILLNGEEEENISEPQIYGHATYSGLHAITTCLLEPDNDLAGFCDPIQPNL